MNPIIQQAVALLNQGELVAFPTETVYGLGADATNPEAIAKIFKVKGRPQNHPVIVHIADMSQLNHWARNIPDYAYQLAEQYWPGPMTLILPVAEAVSPLITGNQPSIGIRMPSHPIAQELLKAFGKGIVAPSANRFGHVSTTTAEHVKTELGNDVALIIDGGACDVGLESTIIDCTSDEPRILRPGPIIIETKNTSQQNIPRASGSLEKHYAPATPLYILSLEQMVQKINPSEKIAIMSFAVLKVSQNIVWRRMPLNAEQCGKKLYATLRELDQLGVSKILVEALPEGKTWDAIRDRLTRASYKERDNG